MLFLPIEIKLVKGKKIYDYYRETFASLLIESHPFKPKGQMPQRQLSLTQD